MKQQDSKNTKKNNHIDKLLTYYHQSIIKDEDDVKNKKEEFVKQIKNFNKEDIKNTFEIKPEGISLWMRIKKTFRLG
jgi:hypothetical protein